MAWDNEVDLLVVGSGNGAMTAAISAHEMGAREILLVEKANRIGGTSCLSGGGIWIPNNRYAKAAGAADSFDEAKRYLLATTPKGAVPEAMVNSYLANAPRMIDFLHERAGIRYRTLEKYPDYYTEMPGARTGHRSLEPEPVDMALTGEHYRDFLESGCYMFDRYSLTQVEGQILVSGNWKEWITVAGAIVLKHSLDIPWVFTHKQSRRGTCGLAGIVRLWLALQQRNIPIWLNSPFVELVEEAGRVAGAVVNHQGKRMRIKARKGVVLAAGGFEQNQAMREQYLPQPTNAEWSAGCKTNTGDAILAGISIGAATARMEHAWWCTTLCIPGKEYPWPSIGPKCLPGTITVNSKGRRISNESQNYMKFIDEAFALHKAGEPCSPMYMVFDHEFKSRYPAYPLMGPNFLQPKRYRESGFAAWGSTLAELAGKLGIDAAGLEESVAKNNAYAKTGKDLDHHRGDAAYDWYYGDKRVKPNPCLGPIVKPPFYAMRMQPGDLGTAGGLVINPHGQVMNSSNQPIKGLYACGNCTSAVLPTYPGPGSTLGPAMTFAYQAAKHMTGWREENYL